MQASYYVNKIDLVLAFIEAYISTGEPKQKYQATMTIQSGPLECAVFKGKTANP